MFNDYIDVIYPKELEIKHTTNAPTLANYLDIHLELDEDGKLFTRLDDKRDDFDFHVVNFPYLSNNIPESPAYGVFVSQLIRYARVCSKYEDFLFSGSILVSKLLKQRYLHGNFRLFFGNYLVAIQTMFTNLTPLCHISSLSGKSDLCGICIIFIFWR